LFTTSTIELIEVPAVVVPSLSAQCCWVRRCPDQPQAIICIEVGPHQ
jgi:hypothetical protein